MIALQDPVSNFAGDLPVPDVLKPWMPLIIGVASAILIFVIGWIVSRWAAKLTRTLLQRREVDAGLSGFLASLAQYLVLGMTVIAALETVGVGTTSLVAVLGSAGIAIGLALQGNLSHFASGVMLLFFRPIKVGDFVTIGGQTGTVEEIGLFATRLHALSNEAIFVANGAVTSGVITNFSANGKRRGAVEVGVAYGSDIAEVMKVLEKAARKPSMVMEDPAPAIAFVGLGASSLDFKVMTWCEGADYLAMLHEVRTAVYDELNAAGIEIPFAQIVVHQAEADAAAAA